MEPLNEPAKFDYSGLSLEKLRGGIVRDMMLSMTGRKKDADETYEQGYYSAFNGGMLRIDSDQVEYQIGGGAQIPKTLHDSFPPDSKIELTLTPQGPLVDGATVSTLIRPVRLGDDGRWQSTVRAIYPGTYTATARLLTPDGQAVPLHLSLTAGKTELHPGGYDRVVMDWHSSVTVDFQPNDLGPMPRIRRRDIWLYFRQVVNLETLESCGCKEAIMSTRPRPSSVLFWLLIVATAAVTASVQSRSPRAACSSSTTTANTATSTAPAR